jgi:hypothetical protein
MLHDEHTQITEEQIRCTGTITITITNEYERYTTACVPALVGSTRLYAHGSHDVTEWLNYSL